MRFNVDLENRMHQIGATFPYGVVLPDIKRQGFFADANPV
jgi:hypothetical protein